MRVLRTMLVFVLAASIVAGLAGCGCGREVAATVNGEKVYVDEIDAEIEAMKAEYPDMFQGVDGEARDLDFRRRILENLVVGVLLRQAAEDRGIEVSDSAVEDAIAEIKSQFPDEESFLTQLEAVGLTEEQLWDDTHDSLLSKAITDEATGGDTPEITEAEIQEYYDANLQTFSQEAAKRAAHILFAIEDEATAQEVLQQIRDGAAFAQMARQYSIDPSSKERDGDLGWPSTPYVSEFQAALDELEVGEVSDLVETVFGWHIITVLEAREASTKTLEEASEEIVVILQERKKAELFQQFVDELRAAAEIEYFVDYAPVSAAPSEEATAAP